MKKMIIAGGIIFLGVMAAVQAGEALKAHPDSKAWEDVFAADLSNAVFPEGVWSWKDGELSPKNKDQAIWTKKEYENFVLDLEFKLEPAANSGVFVYNTDMTKCVPNTVEIQVHRPLLGQHSRIELEVSLRPTNNLNDCLQSALATEVRVDQGPV